MEHSIVGTEIPSVINRSVSCFTEVTLSQKSDAGGCAARYKFAAFKLDTGAITFKLLSRGNPSFNLAIPIDCESEAKNIYFQTNIMSVEKDQIILAIPTQIKLINKRAENRVDTTNKNFDVIFFTPDRLDFSIQNVSLRGKLVDISETGLSLNTSVYESSTFKTGDRLIFTLIKNTPFKVGVESELVYVRHLNIPTLHPYFKIGVKFKKKLNLADLKI